MGRKSIKTLFKKPEDAAGMSSRIEEVGEEIESLAEMNDLLTIYLGETVVPEF
jgi:hypothetical protein